ncbi:MAG TPA: ABC transporter substrate-binding protein [Kofleriaceae bacterium]|jgi:ABC-type transport system substrate-binding protein|nr:ABC transporter substrate-binding protein [Kofleriaceae bacterium]
MTTKRRKGFRAGLLWLAVALVGSSCEACHCDPYRNKPWTRLSDPPVEPSPEMQRARSGAGESAHDAILTRRPHTLRVHMDVEPRHLNPFVAPSVWTLRVTRGTVFETLIHYQPPEGGAGAGPGRYLPGLARSWTVSPDGMQIRVELRDDVRFHDGRRMTSADAQFALDSARDPRFDADHLRSRLVDVEKVDRSGEFGLLIWLRRPSGWVLRALAEVPILPEHVYTGNLRPAKGPVVGTGPYALVSWADGIIHLHAFADYWGTKPSIADIEFVHEADAARAITAAKRGELDILPELIAAHLGQKTAPGIACTGPDDRSCFVALQLRPPVFRYLVFDTSRPPFDDVRVRRAVSLLVSRKQLADAGLARPIAGPVWPGGPGDGPSPAPPPYEPTEAYQLLDAAGWQDGDRDGRRERHHQSLHIDFLLVREDDPESKAILKNLQTAGFVVDDRSGGSAFILTRLRAGDFHLALLEWRGLVDDDLSPLLETGGALNFGKFSSPVVDQALAQLRDAGDPPTRATRMAALSTALADTWPLSGVVAPEPAGLIHKRVRGAVVWNGWISLTEISLAE